MFEVAESVEFNEDIEEAIQTMCSSDEFLRDSKADKSVVVPFCERTMTVYKRNIAEQAMKHLNDVRRSWAPFTNQVCGVMTGTCPERAEGRVTKCETCKALVEEAEFDLSTEGPADKALPAERR